MSDTTQTVPTEVLVEKEKTKRSRTTLFVVIGAIVLIPLLCCGGITIISALGGDSSKDSNDTKQSTDTDKVEEQVEYVEVSIKTMSDEYDSNKLSAQEKYKGMNIKTTGYINDINSDLFGSQYISIVASTDSFLELSVHCVPTEEFKDKLLSLSKDDKVTIQGKIDSIDFTIVSINKCEIVE